MENITLYYDEKNKNVIGWTSNVISVPNSKITTKEDPDYILFEQKMQAEIEKQLKQQTAVQMRVKRTNLLKESDWTDLPNSPVKNKEAWLTYRQALRDLPQDFKTPEEVVWPEKPE